MTAVVKLRNYRNKHSLDASHRDWMYIGRGDKLYELERSPLANPFKRGGRKPGATLPAFKRYLWKQVQKGNQDVIGALREIKPTTALVCHCDQPGPCHGHVVIAAAEWVRENL